MTYDDAEKIVLLHKTIGHLKARMAQIELMRTRGTSWRVKFKYNDAKDRSFGQSDGLDFQRSFPAVGQLDDFAITFLARYADEIRGLIQKTEREIVKIGGTL